MKKSFKCLSLLLVALLPCMSAGCAESGASNSVSNSGSESGNGIQGSKLVLAPVGCPDYSAYADYEFPLGAWNPTPAMKSYNGDMFKYAKEAGINFLCDLRAAQHPGTKLYSRLQECIDNEMRTIVNLSGYTYETDIRADEELRPYLESEYFMGINFWDEPATDRFEELEGASAAFKADYPDKLSYVNLLPNYATTGQLGAGSFGEYVQAFVEKVPSVDHLSYDFYPLIGKMSGDEVMSHGVWDLWLMSLEVMANAAKTAEKDLWVFVQSMSFGANNRAPQFTEDITFQNYVNMCFGAKAIQYFCLTTPEGGEFGEYDVGMLDKNCQPTYNFNYVKEANEELNAFAYIYQQFQWENVMPVYGKDDTALNTAAFDNLENPIVTSDYFTAEADYSVLIGKFHDDNGYNGYMLVNYSDPLDYQDAELTMNFNANRLLVCADGKAPTVAELADGVYKTKLSYGAGQFVIPFNV